MGVQVSTMSWDITMAEDEGFEPPIANLHVTTL
jgi:hypothetical protein